MSELARHVLDSMRCGVVTVDRTGRVTTLSPLAASWLGVERGAALGADCRQAFSACPAVAHLLLDALGRGTLPDRAELELEVEGSRRLLIGFSLSQVVGDDGELLGSAIFFKDLTVVEEERERQALRKRLGSLGEMAAQLAHEVRNRLGGIRVFLGLTRRRLNGDAEGQGYLDRCEAELLEANAKMTEVLDFVRPLRLEVRPTDAEGLCRDAVDAVLARLGGGAPRVEWSVAPGLPPVAADPPRVRDAVANLVANAVEAAGPDGTVWVRLATEDAPVLVVSPAGPEVPGLRGYGEGRGSRVRIEVEDDGPGMPPEVLRRIFHPFFTTKDDGTGLGVPTAQKILDAHAGSVDVESKPGRGTRVIVRLPAVDPEEG